MKILIRDLPHDGTVFIEREIDPSFLGLDAFDASAVSPVHCALDAGLSGGGFFALGSVSVRVRLTCVACLEQFDTTLKLPDFAVQIDLSGGETVDLTDALREDILLTLPPYPRCDMDGTHQCPANFPTAPGAPLSEEVTADSSAWNALDQLKKSKR